MRGLLCWLWMTLATTLVAQTDKADSLLQNRDTTVVTVLGSTELLQSSLNGRKLLTGTEPELINALDQLPGMFKIHEAGFPLVYRGMADSRLRIERNGALRTGFVQQGYLLNDVNPDNVTEMRIVKGAESVLFGTGASGGVITIDEDRVSGPIKSSLYASFGTNASAQTLGLTTGSGKSSLRWLLSGRQSMAGNFSFGNGETALNSARDQSSIKLALQSKFKTTTRFTWNHDWSQGFIERPQGFQNNPFELRRYKNHYNYQSNLKAESALQNGDRLEQNAWVLFSENDQELRNFNGTFTQLNVFENRNYTKQAFGYRINWFKAAKNNISWRFGADFVSSRTDQRDVRDNFINQVFGIVSFTQSRRENMGGLFGLAHYEKGKLQLDISARTDMAGIGNNTQTSNYSILSGGATATWQANPRLQHSLSLTRQFRYPTQDESVGIIFGGRGIFRGNPDIRPEFSNQLEYGIKGKIARQWDYAISGWLALFEGRISEFFLGNGEFTYRNLSRARTMGIEGRLDYLIPNLSIDDLAVISITGSWIQGDDLATEGWFSAGEEPLLGIPPGRIRLSGRWQKALSNRFSLTSSADIEHVLDYDRLPSGAIRQTFGVQATDSYWLLNLDFSGQLQLKTKQLQLGIRMSNLTNSSYFPFGARIMGIGRDIRFYIRFTF